MILSSGAACQVPIQAGAPFYYGCYVLIIMGGMFGDIENYRDAIHLKEALICLVVKNLSRVIPAQAGIQSSLSVEVSHCSLFLQQQRCGLQFFSSFSID